MWTTFEARNQERKREKKIRKKREIKASHL